MLSLCIYYCISIIVDTKKTSPLIKVNVIVFTSYQSIVLKLLKVTLHARDCDLKGNCIEMLCSKINQDVLLKGSKYPTIVQRIVFHYILF